MNEIRFLVRPRDDLGVHEVVPRVDGELLTEVVEAFERAAGMDPPGGYGGLIPAFFRFGPLDEHFHGRRAGADSPATPVLGCDCGEWGCWPFMAHIDVTDTTVTWAAFTQPHRPTRDYTGLGPL